MRKVEVGLQEDVYQALREAYSLKEIEDMLNHVLRDHLDQLKKTGTDSTKADTPKHDNADANDHEWTH